jgi:solute:Na+ symporter, SSS family
MMRLALAAIALWGMAANAAGGGLARSMEAWRGRTPVIDGVISPGEWDDATAFSGVAGWTAEFTPVADGRDLALKGWVKHDGHRLFFAFEVTDDVLYGIDTERWLPEENGLAHELSRRGYPWFGDEMELLMDAARRGGEVDPSGDGASWQMVCNLTKSRLGGIGRGGLLEGEPRSRERAWKTYRQWIVSGAQQCAARRRAGGGGYVMEWAVSFTPCLEMAPGRYYDPARDGDRAVGLNIALGDLDQKERGAGNFGHFHHEQWWAGERHVRTHLGQFGTLWLRAGPKR